VRPLPRALAAALCAGLVAGGLASLAAQSRGAWTTAAPLDRGWEEVMGAAIQGKLYLFEGLETLPRGPSGLSGSPVQLPRAGLEVFDPVADRWSRKPPMPIPAHHAAVAAHDGKLYVFGGFVSPETLGGWSSVANVFVYDPATERWSPRTPMPTPRGGAHAAAVGGKIYVIGGYATSAHPRDPIGSNLGSNEEYDPATDTWVIRAPMPTPRNHHAIGAIGGKIYVAGGRVGSAFAGVASDVSVTEAYDPAANRWAMKAAMPTARSGLGYAVLGERLYVFGGEIARSLPPNLVYPAVESYDPAANRWETYAPMPTPRHAPAAAAIGGKIYVVSGNTRTGGGSASPVNEVFEP